MSKQVRVKINKYGDTKIDAEGFQGASCIEATQTIEQALAGTPSKRDLKPEYDEQESGQETEALRF